jgi:DNA polymerase-1
MATKKHKLRHLFLVDGSGFIFRAFHALPPLTRKDGTPVGAVYGFTAMLSKLLTETDADHIAIIFDAGRITFRNRIYPDYKAHRDETPEELIPQFPLIRDATRAFNLPAVEMQGFEADDLIATYTRIAREQDAKVTIVSSDKDLMQLVEDHKVVLYDHFKNREIGRAEVEEKFGVAPERVIDVQALAGDASDNVPGVPGIGVKTAAQLIERFGDLDSILERAEEVTQPKRRQALIENAELARISRELVTLKDDVPVDQPLDSFELKEPDPEALLRFLEEQEFKSLAERVGSRLSGRAPSESKATEADYRTLTSLEELRTWIARATLAGSLAVDTETTSLDEARAELVGVSLAIVPNEACYIPLAHKAASLLEGQTPELAPGQIALEDAIGALKPLLEDAAVLKVGQNIKYDMRVLARYGIEVAPVDDTMVISYVLDGGLHGHGMDELARLHLDHATIPYKDVAGTGKAQVTFDQVPIERAAPYAAEDADVTLRLHRVLKPRLALERMTTVYETIERPLIPVLARMENTGIAVDRKTLERLSKDFAKRIAALEEEIHALAGHEFTIGSPKQLGEVLFDEMGLPGAKKGKSGAYATGAGVLDELAALGHDLPARVLDWRQLSKLKSTYTDALIEQINPATERVHTSYGMAIASTGRLSSSDPNLQNIPVRTEEGRKIRRAFVPGKGCKLLSADYSQIELRILAHIAEIDALKEAFREGLDIHALTASQVFGIAIKGMDAMTRRRAKAINFGIIYGISPFGLARQLGIAQSEAADYIATYFERYPGIKDYMEETKVFCRKHGHVSTLFGRKVHLPGITDKNHARRSFMERAAINAPIQGTAADIIKRAMIRIPGALESARLKAKMLLQVHDELIFEVPEKELTKTAKLAKKIMEGAAHLDVPLTVDTGSGANWDEAH